MARREVLRSLSAVAVAAILIGCVSQEPFGLPPLGSPGAQHAPSATVYYGYGTDPRYGYYPYSYYPYFYGPDQIARPYPPPGYQPYPWGPYCMDANRDGRCDVRHESPGRDQEHDANMFERLRDAADTRAGAGPTVPRTAPATLPGRLPPPPKVAPPKTSQATAAQPDTAPARRVEQPGKRRSILIPTDEP